MADAKNTEGARLDGPLLFRIPDAEFIELLRAQDRAAWEELRGFLRRLAGSKAWGVVDESHDPEDFVQLACLRFWKVIGRPQLTPGATSLKAYLAVTMQNLIHETHRRRGGVTSIPRGESPEASTPRHRVDLEEAERTFDDHGVPQGESLEAEHEERAAEAFHVLELLAAGRRGRHVRKIAARLLEQTRARTASTLLLTLETNLFQLLYGDTRGWSERKRTKHRVRLNRFREAFVAELAQHRRRHGGETP
ncbi:MAG: hypothetical protein ABI333_20850 [bacterium]